MNIESNKHYISLEYPPKKGRITGPYVDMRQAGIALNETGINWPRAFLATGGQLINTYKFDTI